MFRSFLYIDNDALSSYSQQLGIGQKLQVVAAKGRVGTNSPLINAGLEVEGKTSASVEGNSLIARYNEFENALKDHINEDYFDCLTDSPDIGTIPPFSLLRFQGRARIPESFDILHTFAEFAPFLAQAGQLDFESGDVPNELVERLLGNRSAEIPLLVDGLEMAVYSKLKSSCFINCDLTDFEEMGDQEAVFLCKLISRSNNNRVPIYDPLKDFMKLNRMMRRGMSRTDGLEIIYEDGPAIKVEVVAIYQ